MLAGGEPRQVSSLHTEGRTDYHRFRYLHEVQAFLTSLNQMQVVLDVEKWKSFIEGKEA